jgi:hypothetical protein
MGYLEAAIRAGETEHTEPSLTPSRDAATLSARRDSMPRLFFTDSGATIAEITAEQLDFLNEVLVAEDPEDRDYYVNQDTLEMLEEEGCDPELLTRLKSALGDNEEMDIGWDD